MTMFSMKPKFNIAEFLAAPAPKGRFEQRNMMSYTSGKKPSSVSKAPSALEGTKTPPKPSS